MSLVQHILAKLACLLTGHLWPKWPGACETRIEPDAWAGREVRCGWGSCARCGLMWETPWKFRGPAPDPPAAPGARSPDPGPPPFLPGLPPSPPVPPPPSRKLRRPSPASPPPDPQLVRAGRVLNRGAATNSDPKGPATGPGLQPSPPPPPPLKVTIVSRKGVEQRESTPRRGYLPPCHECKGTGEDSESPARWDLLSKGAPYGKPPRASCPHCKGTGKSARPLSCEWPAWYCPDCGRHNEARYTACLRCSQDRPHVTYWPLKCGGNPKDTYCTKCGEKEGCWI